MLRFRFASLRYAMTCNERLRIMQAAPLLFSPGLTDRCWFSRLGTTTYLILLILPPHSRNRGVDTSDQTGRLGAEETRNHGRDS